VVTAADFPDHKFEYVGPERVAQNFWHMTRNVMAREKALYEGHAVAAVAAISKSVAEEAASLVEIDYEVLPHVIDVDEAMKPDAPLLFEDMITRGIEPAPTKPSNISKRIEFKIGETDAGFAEADEIVEKEFKTAAVHQAYIEPHACVARFDADGQAEIWASSQGHFVIRALTAKLLGMPVGDIRVTPAEIGGGFGGKDNRLSRAGRHPARQEIGAPGQDRDEPRRGVQGLGPDPPARRCGSRWASRRTARSPPPRASSNSRPAPSPVRPVMNACLCAFAPYNIPNQHSVGYDVVCNRPKSAAYRAPGSPISAFAVESVLDILAKKIGIDPLQLRLKNAARPGTPMIFGPKLAHGGYAETLEALVNHPAYKTPLGPNQGRGVASGYWFNGGGESSASVQVNEDGTVIIATGSPDIGGSRASMALMAAETLGIDYNQIRSIVADTSSVGYTHVTGGSRVTFATGMAVVDASKKVVDELRARAAMIWDVDVEGRDLGGRPGQARQQQCRRFCPLVL